MPHPELNIKWLFLSNSIISLFVVVIIAITLEKSLKLSSSSFMEISFLIVLNLWLVAFSIQFVPTQGSRKILNENTIQAGSLEISNDLNTSNISDQEFNENGFELSENQYDDELISNDSLEENSSDF
ncbi:hypothetical protein M0812_25757 [Anaeramoeba flamelloides]|nr:hypothetical protein M0812_25757 [Anaeramoeba flamelloides]